MNWILIAFYIVLGIFILWNIFGLLLPFLLLLWYLRSSRACKTKEIVKLAKKLKKKDKEKTLKNVYKYMNKTYQGYPYHWNPIHLFDLRNFTVRDMLKRRLEKKKFLWCYSQVKLMKALLVATKQFSHRDIKIRWTISHLYTPHQYLIVRVGKERYKVDPFYHKFKKI